MGEDQRFSMVENKPCLKPPAKNEFLVRRSLLQIPKLRITKLASGLICRRRLPVLMRVSNSSPWSPRLPAEVGHRWPCKPGGNLRTAWPRALVKRPALSLASCCKLWQSAFSVKTRELSFGAWAGLKPAPRPWPILDEAACA